MGDGDMPPAAQGTDGRGGREGLDAPLEARGLSGFLHQTLTPVTRRYAFILTDKAGRPIRSLYGREIQVPPRVTLGELIVYGERGRGQSLPEQFRLMLGFRHYGPLDFQRLGGVFHSEYVDFSTVAIGLVAAAMGLPLGETLRGEEVYGLPGFILSPGGWARARKDSHYWPLPERNVYNTELGYRIYQSGDAKITWAQLEHLSG